MDNSISLIFFDKSLTSITLDDVKQYFQSPQNESNILEFKAFHSHPAGSGKEQEEVKNILRSIPAFANSDGGLLIWGSPKGDVLPGKKEKVFQGALTLGDVLYEKDAFMSKMANRIMPAARDVLFHRVEDQGKYAYLLEIAPSEHAPHQFENVYYMRMDGQTLAAPHHYIEAMFKRVSFPKIEAYLRVDGYKLQEDRSVLWSTLIFRNQSRYQNDEQLLCRISTDHGRVQGLDHPGMYTEPFLRSASLYDPGVIAPNISYGNYLDHRFTITLSRSILQQMEYQIKTQVVFGARYAPMKINRYTFLVGPSFPKEVNDAIFEKKENVFFHEDEADRGLTDADILARILNDHSYDPSK